ncbi:MAG: DUF3137 domain-containing protein [Candidatus Saccharibacteria bacterium]
MNELIMPIVYDSLNLFSIAGGGGSGGGGGGGGGSFGGGSSGGASGPLNYLIIALIVLVFVLVVYSTIQTRRANKLRREKTRVELATASATDSLWNQQSLIEFANSIFLRHQKDWSAFNLESMKQYMTPAYLYHTQLMMAALKGAQRQNQVDNIMITSTEIVDVSDSLDNTQDHFGAVIVAQVDDIINNTALSKQIHKQTLVAEQTYKFQRLNQTWLFSGIDQSTASMLTHNAELEKFAAANNFCYSLDWGWLLLPERGQLFGSGKFGLSDINNHIIGVYNNVLIQLYTYSPNSQIIKNYLIAQTSVPKSYGDIVVRRRRTGMNFKIRGLNKLSTEWGDFNKKYDVFASNAEQATSFELLNPLFMEKLESLPFEVNIEVVDNVVYLYADENARGIASLQDDAIRYGAMLEVLKAAFKEMRM